MLISCSTFFISQKQLGDHVLHRADSRGEGPRKVLTAGSWVVVSQEKPQLMCGSGSRGEGPCVQGSIPGVTPALTVFAVGLSPRSILSLEGLVFPCCPRLSHVQSLTFSE